MGSDSRRNSILPRSLYFPADLAGILVLTLLTLGSVFLPALRATPLRVVLGLPFMFFVPGYVLIAALFPEAGDDRNGDGITIVERVGFSFVASLVIVSVVGITLNSTSLGIRLVPVIAVLSTVVVGLAAVALRRRLALPAVDRFDIQWRGRLAGLRSELFAPESRTDAVLNVVLAVSLLVAAFSVGYAIVVPTEGQSYTELYLLTEDQGELVADDYPSRFTTGEPRPLVVGVENREHEPVSYTLFVEIHRVRFENGSVRVLDAERLHRFQPRLEPNETWQRRHTIAPPTIGERLRLTYLLYRGSTPSEPTVDNAYRELHLWVNVTAG